MDFKTKNHTKTTGSNTKNVLLSLMKEMNINSKIQTELLQCVNVGKSFPFAPKDLMVKPKKSSETKMKIKLSKLPSKPIQRNKLQIELSGSYEIEKYRPHPSLTQLRNAQRKISCRHPREKERFQNMMAFGQDFNEEIKTVPRDTVQKPLEHEDLINEILLEIKERKDFLDDMHKLGLAKKYIPEIRCQISLRLKELEKLDGSKAHDISSEYNL